jgi:hypothetical protein
MSNDIFEKGECVCLDTVTAICLFTGTNGKNGCTCNCLGCYLGKDSLQKTRYQGNIDQIHELVGCLPNLKVVLIFGNPDVSVDTDFCNEVTLFLQSRNIQVCFVTSGVGGVKMLDTLLRGVNVNMIRFVDFSVDSLDNNKLSRLKGIDYSLDEAVDGIKYCNSKGIRTGVKPTIWPLNMDEDWFAYHRFFNKINVSRFVFHFGSIEGVYEDVSHVSESKVIEIRNKFKNVGTMPQLLLTEEEYIEYAKNYKPQCRSDKGMLIVYLEENGIKTATVCTTLAAVFPEYVTELRDNNVPLLKNKFFECPIADKALGYTSNDYYAVCRHYVFNPRINSYRNR